MMLTYEINKENDKKIYTYFKKLAKKLLNHFTIRSKNIQVKIIIYILGILQKKLIKDCHLSLEGEPRNN